MKKWFLYLGAFLAVLGLFVIIFPSFWVKLAVIIIGLAAIAYGIYNIKCIKNLIEDEKYKKSILIKSIISIVAGVMAVLFPLAFGGAAWSVMIWVLIIYLILSAAVGFYAASLLKETEVDRKRFILENVILLAIAVVLILISPKSLGAAIIRIIGVLCMVAGGALIIYSLTSTKDVIIVSSNVETDDSSDGE